MNSAAGLSALLARAARYGTGPRRCRPDSSAEAAGAVLEAVRGCIAPRLLTVLAEGHACMIAEAAGGCLLCLHQAPPPLDRLAGRALGPGDLDALAEGLLAALHGGQALQFTRQRPGAPPDPMITGVPADLLLTRLGLVRLVEAVADPADYFREAAEDMLLAVVMPGAAPSVLRSDPALTPEALQDIAGLIADPEGPAGCAGDGEMVFLGGPELTLTLARGPDGPFALVLEAGTAPDLAAFWSGMYHAILTTES